MSEAVLDALAEECAENDSRVGITGMLLHKNGCFLQVIEGPCASVGDMYARIEADRRHKNMRKICDRTIEGREFDGATFDGAASGGKSVGFKNLDGMPAGTRYLDPFSYQTFATDPDLALLMLAYFFRMKARSKAVRA